MDDIHQIKLDAGGKPNFQNPGSWENYPAFTFWIFSMLLKWSKLSALITEKINDTVDG